MTSSAILALIAVVGVIYRAQIKRDRHIEPLGCQIWHHLYHTQHTTKKLGISMGKEVIRPSVQQLVERALNEELKIRKAEMGLGYKQPRKSKSEVIEKHTKKIREIFTK